MFLYNKLCLLNKRIRKIFLEYLLLVNLGRILKTTSFFFIKIFTGKEARLNIKWLV